MYPACGRSKAQRKPTSAASGRPSGGVATAGVLTTPCAKVVRPSGRARAFAALTRSTPQAGAPFARTAKADYCLGGKSGAERRSAQGPPWSRFLPSRCARRQEALPEHEAPGSPPCRPLSVGFAPLPPQRVGRTRPRPAASTGPALLGAPSAFLEWCRCKSPCPLSLPQDCESWKV